MESMISSALVVAQSTEFTEYMLNWQKNIHKKKQKVLL